MARRRFEAYEGDLITYLNVATAFTKHGDNPRWCSSNYLNKKGLKRALTLRDQLLKLLKRLEIPIKSAKSKYIVFKYCLFDLMPINLRLFSNEIR